MINFTFATFGTMESSSNNTYCIIIGIIVGAASNKVSLIVQVWMFRLFLLYFRAKIGYNGTWTLFSR